jgi:hypothetical protein
MLITRRYIIQAGILGGMSLILPASALAAYGGSAPLPPEQILGQLLSLGFQCLAGVDVPAPVFDFVIGLFTSEGRKTGRATSIVSTARGSSLRSPHGATGQALVNVGLHKSGSDLLVHGHMVDGGKMAFWHEGKAPSYTDPAMQGHVATIIGGVHSYLRASRR